jgi:YggT family protein
MSYLANAGTFLLGLIFGFAIGLFLVRVVLIAVGASFYDPICRFVYTLTNPVITPLRPIVPRWRRVEIASLLVAWLLILLERAILVLMSGAAVGVGRLVATSLVDVLNWLVWFELVAMFGRAILSWVVSEWDNPTLQLLARVTEPVIRPFRRLVKPIAGFDFSLMIASIALILAQMLVLAPLYDLAARL